MKRLHRLIIRTYLGPFVATFFVAVFLLLMQFLWKYIDELIGKGLDFSIIAELMLYASATMVPMALPLAILMSSIMTFGNLGEKYELVAIKSSGISLQRIMFPLIVVTLIICWLAFLFSNNILPVANLKMRVLLHDIRHKRPELDIKPGMFYDGVDNFIIKIADKNRKTNVMYDMMIYDHSEKRGNVSVILADSGKMEITPTQDLLILTLWDGSSYEEVEEEVKKIPERAFPHRRRIFLEQTITVALEGFGLDRTDESLYKDSYGMMSMSQLEYAIDSLTLKIDDRKRLFAENLLSTNYFRKETKLNDSLKKLQPSPDSVHMKCDVDSLWKVIPKEDRMKIISMASNYARSTKTYVNTTGEDYFSRFKWIWRHEIAWHKKISLSIACLVLFFVGAPLGAIIRKGGIGMPVVVSVLLFIFYYVIDITGEKFVKEGVIAPIEGMWLSTAILFPFGIFLTYKASTDSALMNVDSYLNIIQKILAPSKFVNRVSRMSHIKASDDKKTDIQLVQSLKNVKEQSRNIRFNIQKSLPRYLFTGVYVWLIDEIQQLNYLYINSFNQLISQHGNTTYFKSKLSDLPFIGASYYKRSRIRTILLSLGIITVIPALMVIIVMLIRHSVFVKKLKTIEAFSTEFLTVLENPAYLEMQKDHEHITADK